MKKIAFKNFRRFQDFPELELGNISIMVGRNNSGKSTMVKAILLVLDYLQNQQYNEFSFTNKSLEDANIVTFGRAKNNRSESNEIQFKFELEGYAFSICIYGDDESTNASVSKIIIQDSNLNTTFEINYEEQTTSIVKTNSKLKTRFTALTDLMQEWKEIENEINKDDFKKESTAGLRMFDRYNTLTQKIEYFNLNLKKENDNQAEEDLINLSHPLKINSDQLTEDTILQELISDFIFINDTEVRKLKLIRDKYAEEAITEEALEKTIADFYPVKDYSDEDNKTNLEKLEDKIQELVDVNNYKSDLTKSIDNAIKAIKNVHIYYLGANPSKQSALFSIRDKQNNLAQAIHDFKQSKILKGEPEYLFVKHWMKEFEIGADFEIKFYAGEAYEFYVKENDNSDYKAHLADKGMGSLQAMMLILKVATILRKHRNTLKYVTIIVEEPELNLHPALQSKLTSLFHTVNTEYSIEFIIETHSEYLIRKSQLFVAENQYTNQEGLNPNPFKVHYFDINNGPYEMNYRKDGRFTNEFETGFFDVNSNLIFDLP